MACASCSGTNGVSKGCGNKGHCSSGSCNKLNTFDWLAQRPCARRRGIGTRLPFDPDWIIESLSDSTITGSLK